MVLVTKSSRGFDGAKLISGGIPSIFLIPKSFSRNATAVIFYATSVVKSAKLTKWFFANMMMFGYQLNQPDSTSTRLVRSLHRK